MYCIKCGNETESEQIFCNHCLSVMEQYPVKPGTSVQLPRRKPVQQQKKQSRRKNLSPEEQLIRMRVTVRTLAALLCVSLLALGISIWLNLLPRPTQELPAENAIGQNYTEDTSDNATIPPVKPTDAPAEPTESDSNVSRETLGNTD